MLKTNMMKKTILLSFILFLTIVLFACQTASFPTNELPSPTSVGSFESYDSLKDYLSLYYTANTDDFYYFDGVRSDAVEGVPSLNTDTTSEEFGSDDTAEYSQTNNQVDGVSESDRILTDGRYIYVTSNYTFFMIDSETLEIVNEITYENAYILGMYLTDSKVVIILSEYQYEESTDDETIDEPEYYYYYRYTYGIRVNVYSIADPENLELTKSLYFDSTNMVSSRVIDNTLYLVMDNYQIYYGYTDDLFVPVYSDSAISDESVQIPAGNIYYMPNDTSSIGYLILASVELDSETPANVSAYLGSSYQIFMSMNNLYTVIYRYFYDEELQYYTQTTYVLRFEISDHELVYQARGEVEGQPLNQFSMDEYDGVFRIATTEYNWSSDETSLENRLFLLDATSFDEIELISVLGNLGKPNERIYSVRYDEDIAYVVTFVNTDPLYKIDLSDPENPEVVGELYEEGVSDYLHIINDGLMVGVGRQAETSEYGWTYFTGVKVSLYDTTGNEPLSLETYLMEGEWSYTPVTYDHKAFVYFAPTGFDFMYIVIPVSEYVPIVHVQDTLEAYYYGYSQNAYVFKVYYSGDLELVTKLTHYVPDSENPWYSYYDSIDRTVMIGNMIYTVSYAKIQMYDMSNDFELIASTTLEEDYYWNYYGYDIALID